MRIVVLDGQTLNPGDNPWTALEALGDVMVFKRTHPEEVAVRARVAEIILTNKTRLPAEVLEQLPDLQFIAVLATGYDVVDVTAARARGIPVSNVPEYGTEAVVQHVFALLLELCAHVGLHDAAVHAGEWTRAPDFSFWKVPLVELAGQTMGIIGLGRIGQRVGSVAHALGMRVMAATGRRRDAPPYPVIWADIRAVFAEADVVSLHCPLTQQNARFVDATLLGRMKPSTFLINTARGGLIAERDLADALNAGVLAGAAVDVASTEPIVVDNPLLTARNCIITPHIAWATLAARRRLMETSVQNVRAFLAGKPVNVVNA